MSLSWLNIAALEPWLEAGFARAGGPGGQNVNKVNTRVTLRLDLDLCPHFSDAQRARLKSRLRSRLTREGRLQVISQTARTQAGNRRLAEERLLELIRQGLHVPKTRRPTQPTRASQRRRVEEKRQRSDIKKLRRDPPQ